MRRANLIFVFAVATALLLPWGALAIDTASYRYAAPVEGTSSGYVFFNLPPDVYDKASPSLSDLRIVTTGGDEVPFVIWSNTKTSERKKIETQTLNTSYIPKSYTTFTLDLGDDGIRTNGLSITTKSTDFVRRVTVEGSSDNKKFALLKKDDYIFDLTNEHNIKNLTVSYPTTDYRYIRVTIWDDGEEPLVEAGGEIYLTSELKGESVVLTGVLTREDKKPGSITELVIDLGAKNLPSYAVALSITDQSFKRDAKVLSSNEDDPTKYTQVYSTTIYRITTPRFTRENTVIEYPETRARYIKVVVHNENDRPLSITNAVVSGVPRKITFSAAPGEHYSLYLGNPRATEPSYDIEELFSYIDRSTVVPVTLGPVAPNPGYVPGAELPFTERYPWLLWGAIGLMIALLGAIVLRMMMKIVRESKQ
jgi:hypothetical protein